MNVPLHVHRPRVVAAARAWLNQLRTEHVKRHPNGADIPFPIWEELSNDERGWILRCTVVAIRAAENWQPPVD